MDLLGWHLTGPQAELLAKVLNMVVAFVAVAVFTWLVRLFRRQKLSFIFTAFFLASYVVYNFLIHSPRSLTVWTFYLFGDLFSTLMVATFFAFLNDSVTPDAAKRLYLFFKDHAELRLRFFYAPDCTLNGSNGVKPHGWSVFEKLLYY